MANIPAESLISSLASESLADALSVVADTSLDVAIDSGALDGVPVIGAVLGLARAGRDIRAALYVRKLALFLQAFSQAAPEKREEFSRAIRDGGESERVGSGVLLLLERMDDFGKPELVGRLMAASAEGFLPLDKALRIAAMLDRAYMGDVIWLRDKFFSGTQSAENAPIAESLLAVGFLSNVGFDAGDAAGGNAGVIFEFNDYGELFLKHAFGIDLPRYDTAPSQVWMREQMAKEKRGSE